MSNARFAEFIGACAKALDLQVAADNAGIFKVGERWIELKPSDRGDVVNFLSVVYLAGPDGEVRDDLIARFNVHYLFNGGFSLVADLDNGRVYLGKAYRITALHLRDLRGELIAFTETAAMACTWYLRSEDDASQEWAGQRPGRPERFLKA